MRDTTIVETDGAAGRGEKFGGTRQLTEGVGEVRAVREDPRLLGWYGHLLISATGWAAYLSWVYEECHSKLPDHDRSLS